MLRLPKFQFISPLTLDEAIRLRIEHLSTSMYVAGGTDVYPKMKRRQFQPEVVIALGRVVPREIATGSRGAVGEAELLVQQCSTEHDRDQGVHVWCVTTFEIGAFCNSQA